MPSGYLRRCYLCRGRFFENKLNIIFIHLHEDDVDFKNMSDGHKMKVRVCSACLGLSRSGCSGDGF